MARSKPLVAAAQPVSPVGLLEGQLPGLAAELGDRGGVTGAALDDLAPLPEGAPPLSYLVASWISTYDSPATVWAEELMGGGDAHDWRRPQQIVFPRVVLLLFVGDVSSAALSGEQPVGPSGVTDVAGRLRS